MQFTALVVNVVLNALLLFIAASAMLSHDDAVSVRTWTICAWTSAFLVAGNFAFCIARMIVLWRRGMKAKSLWGIVVLALLPIGAYYLWAGYLLSLLIAAGPIGGD